MNFSKMLDLLKLNNGNYTRKGWNGRGQFIAIQMPTDEEMLPYIYFITPSGSRVPWVASQTDLLSSDWVRA